MKHLFLCINQKAPEKQCCANLGGESFFHYLKSKLSELDLHGPRKIRVSKSSCLGRCEDGPCLVIYPEGVWYRYTSEQDLDEIIETHLVRGQFVDRLLIPGPTGCSNF